VDGRASVVVRFEVSNVNSTNARSAIPKARRQLHLGRRASPYPAQVATATSRQWGAGTRLRRPRPGPV